MSLRTLLVTLLMTGAAFQEAWCAADSGIQSPQTRVGTTGGGQEGEEPPPDYVEVDTEPKLLKQSSPEYPLEAGEFKGDTKVWVRIWVGRTGTARRVEVLKRGNPLFDEAACKCAATYVFSPAMRDGKPVDVWARMKLTFVPPAAPSGEMEQLAARLAPYDRVLRGHYSEDRKAIAAIHLEEPYEYECQTDLVESQITKYSAFLKRYPESMFVHEARANIAWLELYLVNCPDIEDRNRIRHFRNAMHCYQDISLQAQDQPWGRAAGRLYQRMAEDVRKGVIDASAVRDLHRGVVDQIPSSAVQ